MKRHQRQSDGKYHIRGKTYPELVGSRAQVWHGTAYKTTGGLKKSDLRMNKHNRIVSEVKHLTAKKEKRLEKAGYKPKKGKFVLMRKGNKTRKNHHKKRHNKKRKHTSKRRNKSGHCHNSRGRFTKC